MSEYDLVCRFASEKGAGDLAVKTALLNFLFQLHSVRNDILTDWSTFQAKEGSGYADPKITELVKLAQSEGLTLKQFQERQARELSEKRAKDEKAQTLIRRVE